MDGVSKTKRK